MAFNTGLSGLRASSVDLDVTGNNISNASTVGFKGSKAEFGDLYASGFLGSGSNPIGDGVRVQDVKQSFGQGNISFTDNGLDMAIDGDGFFVLNNGGEVRYSRAGQFGIDKDGFVTNNQNMRVQGFVADDDGNLSGIQDDLQIETDNLAPKRTTNLRSDLNLDSRESVLESQVRNWNSLSVDDLRDESVTFEYDGQSSTIDIDADEAVSDIVGKLQSASGVSASAATSLPVGDMSDADFSTFRLTVGDESSPRDIDLDGVTTVEELESRIRQISDQSISASVDEDGVLSITHNSGETLRAEYENDSDPDFDESATGVVSINTDRTVTGVDSTSTTVAEAFNVAPERINAFNPQDQRTYNHATSTTIYDSLGNSHDMTQFFVKQPSPGGGVGTSEWSVYTQIDGEFVGGTDETPHRARFNQDGELQSVNGDPNGEILIDDWTPKDADGTPNGADGPPADGEEITTPIPDPPTSSAFVLDLGNTTQYGSEFGVNDQQQNGYATGRLSGLDVSDEGVLFARYTNGQSKSLGQVALASFNNTNGLSPVGETTWVETFESGQPIIGAPDTGTLGSINASSVEESNVDLSEELVNLIIAQRNYQANAKTIETSDAVTQTIINLR
ncbi:flagellar hook protein FlgE [Marinobacter sp. HL-58]|uniref:flagellar hook protein FlgE n=1 Tax=Marinobacter sp. HL-58 TaxID=1479237 RepID=UPI0004815363|nr:flagellar hook protein FlgE [Marinobacter sp. HL-58]KPP97699.1 MAG: flagellar hook protein FlgE [Marinobacter sp. HL-58]